jgi:crotonobetainyl-CoA:carnitine CoA-transferase CaiB-like acyl-CoA transferase
MTTALKKIRVLDLSRVRAGPTCVRILADFGADVIRVEPPKGLDPNDSMFADNREGGDFQNLNRNKRSLSLNLKGDAGREILHRLVKEADVVVENWRPDVKARLGVDYESLAKINPRIILASISGFGQSGPYAWRPGFDQVIQGMAGLMSVTGTPGQSPTRAGIAIADTGAGIYAALGILLALFERESSGKGQWVHASLLQSLIAMMDFQMARFLNEGQIPQQEGNDHPTCSPMGLFSSSDGDFNIGVAGDGNWRKFCELLEHPEWRVDARFADAASRVTNRADLTRELNAIFVTRNSEHWISALNKIGVPAGAVYSVPQVFEDPQVRHLEVTSTVSNASGFSRTLVNQPVTLERTPAKVSRLAPQVGEHNHEILHDIGYSDADIEALAKSGTI